MTDIPHGRRFIDLTGQTFNGIYVIRFSRRGLRGASLWWCRCPYCQKQFEVYAAFIKNGHTTSCGCRQREITRLRSFKHGFNFRGERRKEYNSWSGAKSRTRNQNSPVWKYYGGRGIKMCQGLMDFETFLRVAGECPSDKTSIDRKDNNGHYSCGQCDECKANGWNMNLRWADQFEQVNNQRR